MKKKLLLILVFICLVHFSNAQVVAFDAKVAKYGQLKTVLGEYWDKVDSLVVSGPINAQDFRTMWECAFYGSLNVLNLENAQVENCKIPDWAFYDSEKQFFEPDYGIIHLNIRKIILPDNIEEIGLGAFNRLNLEVINLPASLRKLNLYSFAYCYKLKFDSLVIPEGVTEIPGGCFLNCQSIRKLVLPSTVRIIGDVAFNNTRLEDVEFPEGLESLGMSAFEGSNLEKAILPKSCLELGDRVFSLCYFLKELRLPEGIKKIPVSFAYSSIGLENVYIPESVEEIGSGAFESCNNLSKIYSLSTTPPICANDVVFSGTSSDNVTVYVPVGSADLYRNAQGWNYFTDFIETDYFPEAGIYGEKIDTPNQSKVYWSNENLNVEILSGIELPISYSIYTVDGKMVQCGEIQSSSYSIQIPKDIYIVKIGNQTFKMR